LAESPKIMNEIDTLYHFQKQYLLQLLENIPETRAYEKQLEGFNSAGWIMGHLCVEGIDALRKLGEDIDFNQEWIKRFSYDAGKLETIDQLPRLSESKAEFVRIYDKLIYLYNNMPDDEKNKPPQSELLAKILPDVSSWLAHHITTHISIHAGNLTVWKKMIGLEINGY
jgi:hypothetical protein